MISYLQHLAIAGRFYQAAQCSALMGKGRAYFHIIVNYMIRNKVLCGSPDFKQTTLNKHIIISL